MQIINQDNYILMEKKDHGEVVGYMGTSIVPLLFFYKSKIVPE